MDKIQELQKENQEYLRLIQANMEQMSRIIETQTETSAVDAHNENSVFTDEERYRIRMQLRKQKLTKRK